MTRTDSHYLLLDRDETVKKMMDLEKIMQKTRYLSEKEAKKRKIDEITSMTIEQEGNETKQNHDTMKKVCLFDKSKSDSKDVPSMIIFGE
jgi:hypothetical protein